MTLPLLQLPSCTDKLCYELTCIKVLVMRLSILFSMHIQRITHHGVRSGISLHLGVHNGSVLVLQLV